MGLQNLLWIFIGGGLGSVFRYLVSKSLNPLFNTLFVGTLTVNIIGSFIMGLLLALESKTIIQNPLYLYLTVGFCGGFTTFSAFASENLRLIKTGEYTQALIYSLISVIAGIISAGIGFYLTKQI
ncbi:fluoride efflux transporter CrcB [Mesohalobacter halotolerans]|uniref:Fluoride-specific ion channel FluC n=1 Tax=Mesohalobacter halotolerans TaxID=1883405 RepID=A0A4U5TT20_9FLAO|nr:fluoride efflux transporter CrcB [Mesohalobacter halotolerans]MBS3738927.1 fluoride efflux transporter CrcB [Psychroflexus sp.]TKS56428.1 fluoride efflux transporter CrcB [Mesohalobacter halotolerans]